jgi:hypothetical protein
VFIQDNLSLPFNTSETYLRGGSNLIHYKDQYMIGGCHSRIYKNSIFEHYTHIILLDTNDWKLVYVSKPVKYLSGTAYNSPHSWWMLPDSHIKIMVYNNIIVDKMPNIIQDPISLYEKDEKYFITINVRDTISLLYEISFDNILDFTRIDRAIGYYDNYIKEMLL